MQEDPFRHLVDGEWLLVAVLYLQGPFVHPFGPFDVQIQFVHALKSHSRHITKPSQAGVGTGSWSEWIRSDLQRQ